MYSSNLLVLLIIFSQAMASVYNLPALLTYSTPAVLYRTRLPSDDDGSKGCLRGKSVLCSRSKSQTAPLKLRPAQQLLYPIHQSVVLFLSGMSSDPALDSDLHPGGSDQAHHSGCPEPSAAAVRPKELRVYLPHPGRDPECHGPALQQLQHPVPENHREYTRTHTHTHAHTLTYDRSSILLWTRGRR